MIIKSDFFKHLCTFRVVAEVLSISEAARMMEMSQPALSIHIAKLEKLFGTLLFERRRPNLVLTPVGEQLYALSLPLLDGINALPDSLADAIGKIDHGEVRVAAGEAVLLNLVPDIAKQFKQRYPGVLLSLTTTIARDVPRLLLDDQVDFAIGSLIEEDDRLRQTPIYHFSTKLIFPKNHSLAESRSISLEKVATYPLIVPPRHSYTWKILQLIFAQHQLDYTVALEASSSEVAKRCVAAGLGIAILSEACAIDDEDVVVRAFERYFPPRAYSLIERRGKFFTPQAQRFREEVLSWSQQSQQKMSDEADETSI